MSKEIEVGSLEEAQAQMAQLNADASANKPTAFSSYRMKILNPE